MRRLAIATICCFMAASPACAVYTDDQLIDHVRSAVIRNHLVSNPDCIDYSIRRKINPRIDEVDLLDHTGTLPDGTRCKGNPDLGVTLFSVIVDRVDNSMASNAANPDSAFPQGFKMLK